jgi:HEAT repeat protein
MSQAQPEVKVDILNWIGRENIADIPAKQMIVSQLKENNFEVKQAAVWALANMGDVSVIPELTGLLSDKDDRIIQITYDALASFKGDITPAVSRAIPLLGDAGKVAGINLLALRKESSQLDTVLELITASASPAVKTAAYAALKDMVADKDFDLLCDMLETAGISVVAPIQQAIIVTLASKPDTERFNAASMRIQQADESKAHLYYIVLAATGDSRALTTLVNSFKQGSDAVKDAAFEAILNWRGLETTDELYAICKDPSTPPAYFDRAFPVYVRLISDRAYTPETRLFNLREAMKLAKTDIQQKDILKQVERTETYGGLLYAGEFLNQEPIRQVAANAVMNIALNNISYKGGKVRELLNQVIEVLDNADAGYQIEAIRKHLNEMPEGEITEEHTQIPFILSKEEQKERFKILFDGTNLNEWVGNTVDYTIANGVISLIPSQSFGGNLYTKKEYANFIFRFEFQLSPAANNGLGIRTPMEGDAAYVGMEVQILDSEHPVYKEITPYQYHGSVYGILPAKHGFLKPVGEWNYEEVIADGDHIKVILNGEVIVDGNIREAVKNGTPDHKEHPGLFNKTGHIGFLGHGSVVQFRYIRIKELK